MGILFNMGREALERLEEELRGSKGTVDFDKIRLTMTLKHKICPDCGSVMDKVCMCQIRRR